VIADAFAPVPAVKPIYPGPSFHAYLWITCVNTALVTGSVIVNLIPVD
jgi:hypothetical protein